MTEIEAILEAARKRYSEAGYVSVQPHGEVYWHQVWGHGESSIVWELTVRTLNGTGLCSDDAPDLPSLLTKLKVEEDAA